MGNCLLKETCLGVKKMKLTKEQHDCPYCHGKMQSDKKMLDKTPDGSAWLDMADSGCFEYHIKGTTIFCAKKFKYCPMCGRPLNEEE